MGMVRNIETIATVIGAVTGTFEAMMKVFKWYEKKHKKDNSTPPIRPIIKGN